MPPRRNHQPPEHNLSWFSAHCHWVAVQSVLEINTHDRCLLERFRHHVQNHDIPYFHSSHQVFVLGPHSRQYFRTSLRSLLMLDYVPRKVKISTNHIPHECRFCPLDNPYNTPFGASHQRPFEYILATPRSCGRPRRETVLQVSLGSESESESEFDSEDLVVNSNMDNSVFNPGLNSDTNHSGVIRITRL